MVKFSLRVREARVRFPVSALNFFHGRVNVAIFLFFIFGTNSSCIENSSMTVPRSRETVMLIAGSSNFRCSSLVV